MDAIWERGEATVRDVVRALSARRKDRAYTTILTVMSRLHEKSHLARERDGKTDVYRPTMTREGYLEARVRADVGALVDEYGEVALLHFARQMSTLDPKRRERLRRLASSD